MWELEKRILFAISQGPWRRNGFAERSVRFFTNKLNSLYWCFFPCAILLLAEERLISQIAWERGSVVTKRRGTKLPGGGARSWPEFVVPNCLGAGLGRDKKRRDTKLPGDGARS